MQRKGWLFRCLCIGEDFFYIFYFILIMYVMILYKFAYMHTVHDIWCFGIPNNWGEKNEGIKQNQQNQNKDDWPSNISRHFLEASGLVLDPQIGLVCLRPFLALAAGVKTSRHEQAGPVAKIVEMLKGSKIRKTGESLQLDLSLCSLIWKG